MATTMKQIADAAKGYSNFTDGDTTTTIFEIVGVISRYMKQLYTLAARTNPEYFAKKATVNYTDTPTFGWIRPADAEAILRVARASGQRVKIVQLRDPHAELAPAIFARGDTYVSSGRTGDPTNEALDFTYSHTHPVISTVGLAATAAEALTLDASWPEDFNELPVLQVAKYLSGKDGDIQLVNVLEKEQKGVLTGFLLHLGHTNAGMSGRFDLGTIVGTSVSGKKGE